MPTPTNSRSVTTAVLPTYEDRDYNLSTCPNGETCPCNPLPTWRKFTVVFTVSWITLAATFASTSILSAVPEIASDLSTSVDVINVTNAGLLLAMGCSWLIWGPITDLVGRIPAYNAALLVLILSCIGTATSNNLLRFTVTRIIGGFSGTAFMITGQGLVADIFGSGVRGTVVGVFLSGSVIGPALGPCIGGIIVSYTSWRVIFWVQTGMAGLGFALSLWVVRDIRFSPDRGYERLRRRNRIPASAQALLRRLNPIRTLKHLLLPNVLFIVLACCLLSVFQYFLLATVRSTINPTFGYDTPLTSGLFYLAPGSGFLVGSILGGWVSDQTARRYKIKRNHVQLPQDRLNCCLPNLLLTFPAAMMVYGWALQKRVGGLVVLILSSFCGGACLMAAFTALNTYLGATVDAVPSHRSAILAEKFILQYAFAAASNAAAVPLINLVGIGLTFTICRLPYPSSPQQPLLGERLIERISGAICVFTGGLLTFVVTKWGVKLERSLTESTPDLVQ